MFCPSSENFHVFRDHAYAKVFPYSGDISVNICGNNFPETSKWKHICLH